MEVMPVKMYGAAIALLACLMFPGWESSALALPNQKSADIQWINGNVNDTKSGETYGRKINCQEKERWYIFHLPKNKPASQAMPVVLLFHGGGGNPQSIRYESGMDQVSDKNGFLLVYPAGTNRNAWLKDRLLMWNDGRPYKDGSPNTTDDVSYVEAILADLKHNFSIDPKRIYVSGYSNGAQFAYRLAKRLSGRIAAIGAVAGQRPVNDRYDAPPKDAISVIQFSGTADPIAPYKGGSIPSQAAFKGDIEPVLDSVLSWVLFDQCLIPPKEKKRVGAAQMSRFTRGIEGSEVILWTLEGGGHTWPGGKVSPGVEKLGMGTLGPINTDINASELMWAFFRNHALR